MILVLLAASGAAWESRALTLLAGQPGLVVLKRCVDVDDLLAAASAGQVSLAVLGIDAPGLDAAAVDHLHAHGVRPVAVVPSDAEEPARARATRIGITALVRDDDLESLPHVAVATEPPSAATALVAGPLQPGLATPAPEGLPRRIVAVWGPAGAPGRTTLATAIAAEMAQRRHRTVLVDADPYGGAVAQQLGVLDEVSGLLSAARLAASGRLAEDFPTVPRTLDAHLSVVTGLPRADRWVEMRAGTFEHLLEVARDHGQVVVDTGFCLEDDLAPELGGRPGRNHLTLAALELADEVVVVGSADPVGLSRLARGLAELRDLTGGAPLRVVVNRMRPTLGWREVDIAGMVAGLARLSGLHFLPEDRTSVDKALVAGRTLIEAGSSPLPRAVAQLVDGLLPPARLAGPGPRTRPTTRRTGSMHAR